MSTSLLYHAFGIRGYEHVRTDYHGGATIFTIRQEPHDCRCSACGKEKGDIAHFTNPAACLIWEGKGGHSAFHKSGGLLDLVVHL